MPAKKPTVQTRLQKKAAKANKIVTGPKGSKPQSTTNAALLKQGNKTTRGGLGSGRPKGTISQNRPKPTAKPAATPTPKPAASAAPKASAPKLTNLNKPVMRTLVRKAAQARKAAAGRPLVKPVEAQRLMSQRAPNIRQGAARLRNIADTPRVRAAAKVGQQIKAAAQATRAATAASKGANVAGVAKGILGKAAVPLAMVQEIQSMADRDKRWKAAKAKMKAAQAKETAAKKGNTSKFAGARDVAVRKAKAIKGSPVLGPKKSAAQQFDSAFKAARSAGKKQFTWRGKKYTTKMKGE